MKNPALKAISALLSLGVVGFLVVQAGVAGCRSAATEKPPASANAANAASDTAAASAPAATNEASAAKPANEPPPPPPTFLPATKAGPIFPPAQQAASGNAK